MLLVCLVIIVIIAVVLLAGTEQKKRAKNKCPRNTRGTSFPLQDDTLYQHPFLYQRKEEQEI